MHIQCFFFYNSEFSVQDPLQNINFTVYWQEKSNQSLIAGIEHNTGFESITEKLTGEKESPRLPGNCPRPAHAQKATELPAPLGQPADHTRAWTTSPCSFPTSSPWIPLSQSPTPADPYREAAAGERMSVS